MGRGNLTEHEIQLLIKNPFVLNVDQNRIIYSDEFKQRFIKEYYSGKGPTQIFKDAGFDPKILGSKRIERAAARWRESYAAGSLGKYEDGSVRCRKITKQSSSPSKQYKHCQEEIGKLKAENELLKKAILRLSGDIDIL